MSCARIVFLAFLLASLNACSVFMAAQSREAPDLKTVQQGLTRQKIETALGKPISFKRGWEGDTAVYQYIDNDDANYKRAAAYAVLDGVTLGMAEFFTFGVEAVQGDRHVIEVIYNRQGISTLIKEEIFRAPVDKPEKIVGIES